MRPSSSSSGLLLLLAAVASATPYPKDDIHDAGYSYLLPRQCDSYCGAENQYCCDRGETCTTVDGNRATCLARGAVYGEYTTTWTETRTFTSTIMTYYEPPPAPTPGQICTPTQDDWEPCGEICCAGWQTCARTGQCSARPGFEDGTTVTITTDGIVTTRYSAPFRITGVTTVTISGVPSATAPPTTTETGDSDTIGAGGGDEDDGGLSPGAIAGIVIGSLVGVGLLLLLCFCCIARGIWNACFGGSKRRERTETVEEHYSRHGSRPPSAYARRERHGGWFGFGRRPSSPGAHSEKKKSGGGWWLGLAGAAATMLALLNLRKDKKPADRRSRSRYSNSYYSYSSSDPTQALGEGLTELTAAERPSLITPEARVLRTSAQPTCTFHSYIWARRAVGLHILCT
ncbi:hypothetical protein B0I35DRAFT_475246 [Stachybotrys elegans]|uniref:Uncharacterized protein n=1 Tax=Stachybotrys elegans TaxID=80388 RepID=A0A8K0SWS7_9HYPO|nr:hypothetical protein B0I35DRAFT_475246 [Stachybotrys elegans]